MTDTDCTTCQNTRAVAEAYTMSWYCLDHGEQHYNPTARIRELEAALRELVALKALKDAQGKTPEYERRQPLAWDAARAVLEGKPAP